MRQNDNGESSHFTRGCDLQGSERDDRDGEPSPIYFRGRERRTAVDREVCDYTVLEVPSSIVRCRRTIVFLDEIHRFTLSQQVFNAFCNRAFTFFDIYFDFQDAIIPFVEQGLVQVSNIVKDSYSQTLSDSWQIDHRSNHNEPII